MWFFGMRMLAIVSCVALSTGVGHATDQLIFGKKLLIKNPPSGTTGNKVVHLGKDPNITVGGAGGAGDPQCSGAGGGGTSSLRIAASGGAGDITIPLPCGGWSTNGTNSIYKYKDTTGATCTLVMVKAGVLAKAICKGAQVAIDLNGAMSPVSVVTTLNTEQYCTTFGGVASQDGSNDKTFLRKNAMSPGSCPAPPTTSSTTSTTVSTTTTSLPACGNVLDPCGSCGSGVCLQHESGDPPNVCVVNGCLSATCTDDSQCAPGKVCINYGGSFGTACCTACP